MGARSPASAPATIAPTLLGGGSFDPAGPIAREILGLWWVLLGVGVVGFAVFAVVLAYALLRPRGAVDDAPAPADGASGRRLLLLGGVALPVAAVLVSFGFTAKSMHALPDEAPPGALEIVVVGHQWWWEVRYPERGITLRNEIRIPVGERVALRLRSADVIHSFWVPRLGGKLDLLPDDENTLVVEADEAGEFRGQCAEFCGLHHADMRITVVAESPAAFRRWLEQQGSS